MCFCNSVSLMLCVYSLTMREHSQNQELRPNLHFFYKIALQLSSLSITWFVTEISLSIKYVI